MTDTTALQAMLEAFDNAKQGLGVWDEKDNLIGFNKIYGDILEKNLLISCLLSHLRLDGAEGALAGGSQQEQDQLRSPAIRIVGNIVSATDSELTDVCLKSGLLPALLDILKHKNGIFFGVRNCFQLRDLAIRQPHLQYTTQKE